MVGFGHQQLEISVLFGTVARMVLAGTGAAGATAVVGTGLSVCFLALIENKGEIEKQAVVRRALRWIKKLIIKN